MGPGELKAGREALIAHMAAKMKEAGQALSTESEGMSSSESGRRTKNSQNQSRNKRVMSDNFFL